MDHAALKIELTTDPLGRGYAAMSDEDAAKSLGVVNRKVNRETLTGGQIVSCVVKAEYIGLSANDKDWIRLLAFTATPIAVSAQLRTDLEAVFAAGATRTALIAVSKRPATRAEELNLGGQPTTSDVAIARQLP